jgi:hypothetical protein
VRDVSYLLDSVNLKFQGERNIDNLFTGMMSWLETQSPVGISQVGILCSQDCAKLIKDSLPPEIITDFRAMLLALSIIHCQASQTGESDIYETLEGIGVAAGHRLLMHLDQVLSPRTSTPDPNIPTAETIKANVLIVLGTIMGIYYTTDPNNSREFHILDSETGSYRPSTLWNAMKEHLCLMLTHHLLFLATRLGVTVPLALERTLIHRSFRLWDKAPGFVWTLHSNIHNGGIEPSPEPEVSSGISSQTEIINQKSAIALRLLSSCRSQPRRADHRTTYQLENDQRKKSTSSQKQDEKIEQVPFLPFLICCVCGDDSSGCVLGGISGSIGYCASCGHKRCSSCPRVHRRVV